MLMDQEQIMLDEEKEMHYDHVNDVSVSETLSDGDVFFLMMMMNDDGVFVRMVSVNEILDGDVDDDMVSEIEI